MQLSKIITLLITVFFILSSGCDTNKTLSIELIDTDPPSTPQDLSYDDEKGLLSWTNSTDDVSNPDDLTYYIFFISSPESNVDEMELDKSTSPTVKGQNKVVLSPGKIDQKHFYVSIVAVDKEGKRSKASVPYKLYLDDQGKIKRTLTREEIDQNDPGPLSKTAYSNTLGSHQRGEENRGNQDYRENRMRKDYFNCHGSNCREGSDNLGVNFQEIKGAFYIVRWDPFAFPIKFDIHASIPIEKRAFIEMAIREVFDHINEVAKEEGIIDDINDEIREYNKSNAKNFDEISSIVELSSRYVSDAIEAKSQTIRFEKDANLQDNEMAYSKSRWDPTSGEIYDADIAVFYERIKEDIKLKGFQNIEDLDLEYFKFYLVHELLHCLGFTHNFAGEKYYSKMDYYIVPPIYDLVESAKDLPLKDRTDYDRIVLKYLYGKYDEKNEYYRFELKRKDAVKEQNPNSAP